jgi:hypothetical protein
MKRTRAQGFNRKLGNQFIRLGLVLLLVVDLPNQRPYLINERVSSNQLPIQTLSLSIFLQGGAPNAILSEETLYTRK